jgi:hypothetical protein
MSIGDFCFLEYALSGVGFTLIYACYLAGFVSVPLRPVALS